MVEGCVGVWRNVLGVVRSEKEWRGKEKWGEVEQLGVTRYEEEW